VLVEGDQPDHDIGQQRQLIDAFDEVSKLG